MASSLTPARVLVVDDDPQERHDLSRVITALGYAPEIACDGEEALEKLGTVAIDAIVTAAYDVISGPAGQERDWERERSLFFPGARLIPTRKGADEAESENALWPQAMDVDGFIARSREFLKDGFFEQEIARRTEQFGHIAHVWSTYESRHERDDPHPFMRGINSFQLFHDGCFF